MDTRYSVVSPSLDGILLHDSIIYEGIRRPNEVLRAFDAPRTGRGSERNPAEVSPERAAENRKVIEQYFHDLYGVFMKKLSHFAIEPRTEASESVKLSAMLQEIIKIKNILARDSGAEDIV